MKFLTTAAIILAAGSLVVRAEGDITFGGNARAFAMGGAGLAVVDELGRTSSANPASLALQSRSFRMGIPSLGLRASGIPIRQAWDHITGNPDLNDAVGLARDFGQNTSQFGVSLGALVSYSHLTLGAEGVATAYIIPNEALRDWARNANGNLAALTGNERADLLGAAVYSLPSFAVAERVSPAMSPTRIDMGAKIKFARALYTHYLASADNIRNNTQGTPAPELAGGTSLSKEGLGVDVGFLMHPRDRQGLSAALVVANLVGPEFTFDGTNSAGAATRYTLQPRSAAVGLAYASGRILAALDGVDLTRAYGPAQARMGVEYTTRAISFRAGYASSCGLTAGIGWNYLQLAVGNKTPLEIIQTLRF